MTSSIAQLLKSSCPPPARLTDFVSLLPAMVPMFEGVADALHLLPDEQFAATLASTCQSLVQSPLLPVVFHPQAGPADCVALLQDCLCHAVMVHPSCNVQRKAALRDQVASPRDAADAMAPLLAHLLALPHPANEEAIAQALVRDRPVFHSIAKVLLVQNEVDFKKQFTRMVDACSAPGSPYAIPSHVETRHSMMRVSAKLALCNTIMSAPGCSQTRRDALISALIVGSDSRVPTPCMPPPPSASPPSHRTGFVSRFR